ncbi:MAG: tetratricopeptide repeat protein [Candidatus Treponema excrementipullorum]|nr:tetratricopeptide repeat protein [Candidatus Treponema excrementipullorum]MDY4707527.1 tetratricopeptide repeat protein [Candidatus Treponema excrementipullorum]
MPGLNQLKKFSEDVKNLGKELDIRKERGEVVSSVPLPEHISEADDSQDFVLGMPLERGDVPTENDADVDSAPDVENAVSSGSDGVQPNLDSILDTSDTGDIDFSAFPELAALLENTSGDDSEASSIPDIDFPSNDTDSVVGMDDPVPQDNDTPSSDKGGASDSQNTDTADNTAGFDIPTFNEVNEPLVVPEVAEDIDDFDLSGFDDDIFSETSPVTEDSVVHDDTSSDLGNMPTDPVTDFNIPDFDIPDFAAPVTDNTDTVQSATDETVPETTDLDVDSLLSDKDGTPEKAMDIGDIGTGGFDLPDFDIPDFDAPVTDNTDTVQSATDETVPETTDLDVDSLVNNEDGAPEKATDIGDIGTGGFDLPDFDGEEHTGSGIDNDELAKFTVPDENVPNQSDDVTENTGMEDTPIEVFDAPDDPFAGEDFGDATNFDDFAIPGFSDQAPGTVSAKSKRRTSSAEKAEKNTLTDKEYEAFLRNLKDYPLNLRIEIEKFIVGDEFKDEVVYDVIQKVIKKVSARHLASHLEKLLDINIPVPREFERRTVAQYEEYKKSAEYQLKNRIIPAAIIGLLSACILFLIFLFAKNFIYIPAKANSIYKEGYALLEAGAYPQSEELFDEASSYQRQTRWFFKYAEGYSNHKQYERARLVYQSGLRYFNHDKKMGLKYAEMELYQLRNYKNAENVVRREVLDYYINDKDGMLLLGDIFLEWGSDKDPRKLDEAYEVYSDIISLYGQKDPYLARLLRYYIRTDDLRNVLQLKDYFYPRKKSLGGQDLVELSGYLLDKVSGNIAPADEKLLVYIEDVRELLERAVKLAPEIPESTYNMGLYFLNSKNYIPAKEWLLLSLDAFEKYPFRTKARVLNHINAYRLLGDIGMENEEYIEAEEFYRKGISLFEEETAAGLQGNKNVGKLYASLGDLCYFITGDFDEALKSYKVSVDTDNDTASIRYKMGYIYYTQKEYTEAVNAFIKTVEGKPNDTHALLALGNTLSIRGDNYAAQGYYERLMVLLENQRVRYNIMLPQVNEVHGDIVNVYLMASNNLGVTQYRLAQQIGDSSLNGEALANFTASLRAWDALTRNPETMVRLPGSNLAERNIAYMTAPLSEYEPAIYMEIPIMLEGEVFKR